LRRTILGEMAGLELVEQVEDARPPLERLVEREMELGDALHAQALPELVADERHVTAHRGDRGPPHLDRTDHAHEDLRVAQVRLRLDAGDRGESDLRIVHLPGQDRIDLLTEELVDPISPGGHRALPESARKDAADALGGETFDDVSLLEVVVPGQADAALVVLLDLADVVAEAAERLDPVGDDDLAVAPDTRATPDDPAVGDEAAGDDRALADAEDLADLGTTLDDLDDLGLEQALESGRDVVGQLVDDVVQADVDTLRVGRPTGGLGDLRAEADDDRVRGGREHDVVVRDVAGALVEDVDPDLVLVELVEGVGDRSERTRHVGLEDDPKLLGLTGLDLPIEVLERR